jgi:hypothetical protein
MRKNKQFVHVRFCLIALVGPRHNDGRIAFRPDVVCSSNLLRRDQEADCGAAVGQTPREQNRDP